MRTRLAHGLPTLALLGLCACNAVLGIEEPILQRSEEMSLEPLRCVLNSDCPEGSEICIFRICSPPCARDRDCADDSVCLRAREATACVAETARGCELDDGCPEGTACRAGVCQTECQEASDCPDGQRCVAGSCQTRGTSALTPDAGGTGDGDESLVPDEGDGDTPSEGDGAGDGDAVGDGDGPAGPGPAGDGDGPAGPGPAGDGDGHVPVDAGGGPSGDGDSGDGDKADGGVLMPECDEGAVRCDGTAAVSRSRCEQGRWNAFDPCVNGQLCDTASTPAGTCKPVVAECVGAIPGEVVCSGAERVTCGPDLVTAARVTCDSPQHCTLGSGDKCAGCLPNDFQCSGANLLGCADDHSQLETKKTCPASAPCNAQAGDCTALACLTGQKRCSGDVLQVCDGDQSGFRTQMTCMAGLCDPIDLECDQCIPGVTCGLDGRTRITCSADGQSQSSAGCPGGTPFCIGAGTCVECTQQGHCSPPDDCHQAACNTGTGQCEAVLRPTGTSCNNATGYCDASGNCVGCTQDSHCSAATCYSASCRGGACQQTPIGSGVGCGGTDVCDGAGQCVQCVSTAQCPVAPECTRATCSSNMCGTMPLSSGAMCRSGTYFCNGSGGCVQCLAHADCGRDRVCRMQACADAVHDVGFATASGNPASVPRNAIFLMRLPRLSYDAVLNTFGIVGTDSSASAHMGIYAGDSTGPTGAALTQTANPIGLAATAREGAPAAAQVRLSKDTTYWLGFIVNVSTVVQAVNDASQGGVFVPHAFVDPFPSNPSPVGNDGVRFAAYITVRDTE